MKVTRRSFIHTACTIATAALFFTPEAHGWPRRGTPASPSGFNGGKSQTNFGGNALIQSIDVMKQASLWFYPQNEFPTDPTAPPLPLLELDTEGYPTTIVAGPTAVRCSFPLFTTSEY